MFDDMSDFYETESAAICGRKVSRALRLDESDGSTDYISDDERVTASEREEGRTVLGMGFSLTELAGMAAEGDARKARKRAARREAEARKRWLRDMAKDRIRRD